jgi:pyruvate/2-oxoglutarate dehydrogenase complex dihydrolipoamide dehydrogenase (E3) component
MTSAPDLDLDLCVLGAGPVAAAVALGGVRLGARTALGAPDAAAAETGVAALLALVEAGRAAAGTPADWAGVRRRIADAAAEAGLAEQTARLQALGVRLPAGPGRFVAPNQIDCAGLRLRARRFVVVAPARAPPAVHTVLGWAELPARLRLDGAGGTAAALAQALARLGVAVALRFDGDLLPGFDPELAGFVARRMAAEGVAFGTGEAEATILAAPEPRPALAGLGLAEAGIAWSEEAGILAGTGGRTTNRRVWTVPFNTPRLPGELAAAVLRAALLRLPTRPPPSLAVAFTDPGLAQVGLDEAAARAAGIAFRLLRWPLGQLARARGEAGGDGLVKVVVDRRGRVLGAGIAGPRAAELIQPWALAVARRLPAAAVAEAAAPSPSAADAGRLAAASAALPLLRSGRLQRWVRLMLRLG